LIIACVRSPERRAVNCGHSRRINRFCLSITIAGLILLFTVFAFGVMS
jgi:hypothetical protein